MSDSLILSVLHAGRITESYSLIQKCEDTERVHPLSEAVEKATVIMKQHHLTDKDIEQAFRVLSDLLDEQGIRIQTTDFSIRTHKGDDWIHYNFHLDLAKPELLPGLETELNVRLSSLPPDVSEALEIDITADRADLLCLTEDISEVIAANDELMQRINEARQGMREGIPGLSYEDVFGSDSQGNIVARFNGKMEAGHRALGNRSILADPRSPDRQWPEKGYSSQIPRHPLSSKPVVWCWNQTKSKKNCWP